MAKDYGQIMNNDLVINARIVCWDFEGCGPYPLQVGVAVMENLQIRPAFFSNLHAPKDLVIPNQSPAFKLDRNVLERAPHLWELWPQLHQFWHYQSFTSHNLGTEKKYLGAFALHRAPAWIDTLKVFRYAYPNLPAYSLGSLLRCHDLYEQALQLASTFPGCKPEEHDPVFDACGCLLLLRKIAQQPGWEHITIDQLTKIHPNEYYKKLAHAKKKQFTKLPSHSPQK